MTRVEISRRTGPRADVDVPAEILAAAEELLGDLGPDAVSLRAVARAAGVAPTAVVYHFRDKATLLRAVIRRREQPLVDRVCESLEGLDPASATTRQVVGAVLSPLVDLLLADPAGGLRFLKIVHGQAVTGSPGWHDLIGDHPRLVGSFLAAVDLVHPGRDFELLRRTGIAMFAMLGVLASADLAGFGVPLTARGIDPAFVEQVLVFTSAGIDG